MLVDTGPLVALIHADDRNHETCLSAFRSMRRPLATTWPVITEAMHLLGFDRRAQDALWEMMELGVVRLSHLDDGDYPRMRELMRKYADLPMDLADASLVLLAERDDIHDVFTIDRRDFMTYRIGRSGRFNIAP